MRFIRVIHLLCLVLGVSQACAQPLPAPALRGVIVLVHGVNSGPETYGRFNTRV
jgi:hypothetical protein